MKEHAEARVDPDFNPSDADIERAMVLITRAMLRMPALNYTERPANGGGKLLSWLLGIISVLLCAAIVGMWTLHGQVQAQAAKDDARYEATQQQLADIKKLVDIRFRNGMMGSNASPP